MERGGCVVCQKLRWLRYTGCITGRQTAINIQFFIYIASLDTYNE
jgi:hypothetical protein